MRGIPKGAVKIYSQIEEIKAIKGKSSLWPNEPFKHDFKKGSRAAIYGLRDGSILVKSQNGKRLWKSFNYDESDGTRSNPMKKKWYYIIVNSSGRFNIKSSYKRIIDTDKLPILWKNKEVYGPYIKKPTIMEAIKKIMFIQNRL